jgi:putative addiction module killer protein
MFMNKFVVYGTEEYEGWFRREPPKSRLQIQDRILKIEEEGYFGNHKDLDDNLYELKFNDGRRIYYVIISKNRILLLLGGNKNGQDKDIRRAKSLITKAKKA